MCSICVLYSQNLKTDFAAKRVFMKNKHSAKALFTYNNTKKKKNTNQSQTILSNIYMNPSICATFEKKSLSGG